MPRAGRSSLTQDLNPLRSDIAARLKKADTEIASLSQQAKDIGKAIRQAQADRKVLVQLAKVAGASPRTARGGGARRGSGERAKQLLSAVGASNGGLTKKEIVAELGVSEVRVQQLLTQAKREGHVKSKPQPGSRRTLVWTLTAAGKDAAA